MTRTILSCLAASLMAAFSQDSLSLAGEWKFALDERDLGLKSGPASWNFPDTILLPGSTAGQGKGKPLDIQLNLRKPAMEYLHQRHSYIGPAWYQRQITIPADWAGKDIRLTLERVLWESRVWIDGQPVGEPQLSLSVPHRYELSSFLKPGTTHELTLRIDNRQKINIGRIGHAYTQQTQSIWNGVIGKLQLEALPKVRVSHLSPRYQADQKSILCEVELTNTSSQVSSARLNVVAQPPGLNGKAPQSKTIELRIAPGTQKQILKVPLGDNWDLWSEADTELWTLKATLGNTELTIPYAPRHFERKGRQLFINNELVFLRGNLECAIFPQTGHPDADGEQWEKIMKTHRDYGLNHLRFHSWCPPEAAFQAADKYGIYLQVELPNWTFNMGNVPVVDEFFKKEGERIFREYGHHPSFVMFSLGNELKGSLKSMDELVAYFRTLAPDVLFTSTSFAFNERGKLPGPQDDFFITQYSKFGWVRGQGFFNFTFPNTVADYTQGLGNINVPLVTHEIGQYVVYPNLAELPKYESTPVRSTALESIKADLEEKGLLEEAARFTRDSGKFAALLYKEEIERALRTPELAGFQLLQLQDFPGQSTATVGLIDAFWDSKGLITGEEFRQFCGPVVPLAKMDKFVWENSETFEAKIEIAHFFGSEITAGDFLVSLRQKDGDKLAEAVLPYRSLKTGNVALGEFKASLAEVENAVQLELVVEHSVDSSIKNSWPIWVYPAEDPQVDSDTFVTHRRLSKECLADLEAGKRVLLLPMAGSIKKPIDGRFTSVFWSPLHFPNQHTLGATINAEHPLWDNFPTDTHSNWQWWELTANSKAVDLTGLSHELSAPFRFIDKYIRNARPAAIFEARVGSGQLLVCTLDLQAKGANGRGLVSRQLERALHQYLDSEDFAPEVELSPEQIGTLFGEKGFVLTATASQSGYPAQFASDYSTETIWHSPWQNDAELPVALEVDLLEEKVISGLNYLPRQDMSRGRIKAYRIQVSRDGESWKDFGSERSFTGGETKEDIVFDKPIKTRYVRILALSEQNGLAFVSCAELSPVFASSGDARDLGIIPGFNDE